LAPRDNRALVHTLPTLPLRNWEPWKYLDTARGTAEVQTENLPYTTTESC